MRSFLSYLNQTADRLPHKLAFSDGVHDMSFQELRKAASALGAWLAAHGAAKEPVPVLMKRSPRQVAAFLGVMEAGCFYVPLDEQMPEERLRRILAVVKPRFLLAEADTLPLAGRLCPHVVTALYEQAIQCPSSGRLRDQSQGDPLMYVVFTSGSTGEPKGVAIRESGLMDYAAALPETVGFEEDTIFGCQAPLYVDAWLKELLGALVKGATVYLIPRELFVQPVALVHYLNDHFINTLCWVSSAFSLVSRLKTFEVVTPAYLRLLCFGSEPMPVKQLTRWQQACPQARIFQLYGPTECTGMSLFHPVVGFQQEGEPIPVGKPFPGTQVRLLNEQGQPAQEGEIYIGGAGVMAGYYGDEEKTRGAISLGEGGLPFYRTGDLGRWNERGELVFLGRQDQQVKHMGHRIELGEVETAALALAGLEECACLYAAERQRIDLVYVGSLSPAQVAEGLRSKLPPYMLPGRVKQTDALPHLPNGKIDRKRIKQEELSI